MPPVIGAVLIYSTWTVVAAAAIAVLNYAYSQHQADKARRRARQAYNDSLSDRLVMTAVHDGPRSRVYGKVRTVDGVIFKATRGADSEFYTLVVALAGHEVTGVDRIFFNDQEVTLDGSGRVQTAPYSKADSRNQSANMTIVAGAGSYDVGASAVPSSVHVVAQSVVGESTEQRELPFTLSGSVVTVSDPQGFSGTAVISWQQSTLSSFATVKVYLGSPTQDISAEMVSRFPGYCTSSDKFRGIALLLVDLEYSPDAFPGGVPQITAEVRGAKILDTRTSTTAYTQNPALIARDWAVWPYGGGLSAAQIDVATVNAAANACAVDLAFTTPQTGTVTQDAYACGIVCQAGVEPQSQLEEIVESMAGRWGFSGGKLRMVAGAWRAPVVTITDSWVSDFAAIEVVPTAPRDEAMNELRLTISDAAQDYIQAQVPPVVAAPYVADDGEPLVREITAAGITSVVRAQYVASVLLREARQSLMVKLPCKHHAWPLELFDVVSVTLPTFGWAAKSFEVIGWEFQHGTGILLTLKEASADVYTIDPNYYDLGYEDNTRLPKAWDTEPIVGLALANTSVVTPDGTTQTRLTATWTALTTAHSRNGRVEIRYGSGVLAESQWATATVPGDQARADLGVVKPSEVMLAKARSINAAGVAGPWCALVSNSTVGDNTIPANVTGLSASATGPTVTFQWTTSPDRDYLATELRRSSWTSPAERIRVSGSRALWTAPRAGSYTWYARHQDRSGNWSAANATVTVDTLTGDEAPVAELTRYVRVFGPGAATQYAAVRFNANGTVDRKAGANTWVANGSWYSRAVAGIGSSHWIMFRSRAGGSTPPDSSSTLDEWLPLSSARFIEYTKTGPGLRSGGWDVLIATDAEGSTIVGTGTLDFFILLT